MASQEIQNPDIPYVGEVESGLFRGKMVKIHGKALPNATFFAINYQLGPNLNPRDNIALHLSHRFNDHLVTRNHLQNMSWGPEENEGEMWIRPGQDFEVIILCDNDHYKIAINGRHFAKFSHRLPFRSVSHLTIDGDVEISSIFYEVIPIRPAYDTPVLQVPDLPQADFGPSGPGSLYPSLHPQPSGYGPPSPSGYGPPPGGYGLSPGGYYGPSGPYGPPPGTHGYQPENLEQEDGKSELLDKVGLALGGLVAAGGAAAVVNALTKKKDHSGEQEHEKTTKGSNESGLDLGALGAALASSLAASTMQDQRHSGGGGGMLDSLLGALGNTGGGHSMPQQQPSQDPLGGLGSLLGDVLGGGGSSAHAQQPSSGNDLLSSLGSSLFSSAMDSFSKRGFESSHHPKPPHVEEEEYRPPNQNLSPSNDGKRKFSASEISKGLGLSDEE